MFGPTAAAAHEVAQARGATLLVHGMLGAMIAAGIHRRLLLDPGLVYTGHPRHVRSGRRGWIGLQAGDLRGRGGNRGDEQGQYGHKGEKEPHCGQRYTWVRWKSRLAVLCWWRP